MNTNRTKILSLAIASFVTLGLAAHLAAKDPGANPKKMPTSKPEPTLTPKPTASPKPTATPAPRNEQSIAVETKRIDLVSKLKTMHLHDGQNLVHEGDGVKLMAESRNNKIVRWSATDEKGHKLTTEMRIVGTVCVIFRGYKYCYVVTIDTQGKLPRWVRLELEQSS